MSNKRIYNEYMHHLQIIYMSPPPPYPRLSTHPLYTAHGPRSGTYKVLDQCQMAGLCHATPLVPRTSPAGLPFEASYFNVPPRVVPQIPIPPSDPSRIVLKVPSSSFHLWLILKYPFKVPLNTLRGLEFPLACHCKDPWKPLSGSFQVSNKLIWGDFWELFQLRFTDIDLLLSSLGRFI